MKPKIVAHRGSSGTKLENTLDAFQLALDQGADGIELDVHLTADDAVVVFHDYSLDRLGGITQSIQNLTWVELKQIRVGNQKQSIPHLGEVLDRFGSQFSVINIEIKSTGWMTNGIEAQLVDLIREFNLEKKILVSSFNPFHLWRMKRLAPEIKRGFLLAPDNWYMHQTWIGNFLEIQSVNLDHQWYQENRWKQFYGWAPDTWVWTVNDEAEMDYWLDQDVQAIITNYPDRLKKKLL